ncbi:MAG: hypothetical protein F6K57_25155 [Moorea sp. SIO4A5]|nr:hypothetical protein [Moorena sp. SIO4A5]
MEDIFLFYGMPGLRLEGESQCMLFDPVGVTGILRGGTGILPVSFSHATFAYC